MRLSPSGLCALASASLFLSSSNTLIVDAAIVDAGALTGVSVDAPYFDTGDCGSDGCYGALTRDSDSITPESRWSCKPDLGPSGSTCSITYTLDEPLDVQSLNIALYRGDTRTRTLNIFIDGTLYTTSTSSGTTTNFEAIDLSGEAGTVIELQGVLADSEWLSIAEVAILVDSDVVEADDFETVKASAALYDTNLSEDGGCDPSGCTASLTRDGDFTDSSRWSCATKLGGTDAECAISYDMGGIRDLSALRLDLFKGDERTRTVQIKVDGSLVTTWTSSGTTAGLERIDLAGTSGQVLEVVLVTTSSTEWLSIIETEIMVQEDEDGNTPSPTPSPSSSTVPTTRTTSDGRLIVEAGDLGWVETESQHYSLSESDGCGVLGCIEENTRDGSLEADHRWSCQYDSREDSNRDAEQCRVVYILPYSMELHSVRVAFYEGDSKTVSLQVLVDDTTVVDDWTSSGVTVDFQAISLVGSYGQSIELIATSLEDEEFLGITEVEIDVIVDDVPLLGVTASDRIDVGVTTSSSDGLPVLDGDTTAVSSWACSSSESDLCSITIDLQNTESVEQISMAFVDDGDIADNVFDVAIGYSADGPFTTVLAGIPSNKHRPETLQQFKMSSLARYVKIEASALGSGSLDISEIDVRISEYVYDHAVTADASLDKVGLLPLALGEKEDYRSEAEGGCSTRDGCSSFYAKDGNLDTFWRCYTDDQELPGEDYYRCNLLFDLAYYRHLKQIRIALFDGAERASSLMFEADAPYSANGEFVTTVISSGTTADFETYDFDHFIMHLTISGLFRDVGESISVSGVEFLEESDNGVVPVAYFDTPNSGGEAQSTTGFGWGSSSVSGTSALRFVLSTYASVTAIELKFPVGESYLFDVDVTDETDTIVTLEGFVSVDREDYQSFTLDLPDGYVVQEIEVVMKGTADGGSSFYLLDARILGSAVDNPTTTYRVGSAAIRYWNGHRYPDFVGEGTGDQKSIMGAICAIKQAAFDGVDCVGGDEGTTGTVKFPMGEYFVDGNIFMKSGVLLEGSFSGDDSPYTTDFILEEGAAGNTDVAALVVFDGVVNAEIDDIWVRGLYNPDTDNSINAVAGLGSMGLEITNSENITADYFEAQYIDGDAVVVTNSKWVELDAGRYDDEFIPWSISDSRGMGVVLDNCDSVYIRRHTIYNNGVAGLQITGSNNVTFDATTPSGGSNGDVGSLDGQQPIEITIDSSTLVTFNDMRVTSSNEPAITVSSDSSEIVFDNCSFNDIESGVCVIQTEDPTVVSAVDDELTLVGDCFVKV